MARIHLTPESLDLHALFMEAAALECEDILDGLQGTKRSASSIGLCDRGLGLAGSCESNSPAPTVHSASNAGFALQVDEEGTGHSSSEKTNASKNRRSHDRRCARRKKKRDTDGWEVRNEVGSKYVKTEPLLDTDVHYVDLPVSSCGFHGRKEGTLDKDEWTPEKLLEAGYTEIAWDGVTPEVIVDKATGTVLVVLAGRPDDLGYVECSERVMEAILRAGDMADFTASERNHRRSEDSAAVNIGVYYGGGTGAPCNLDHGKRSDAMRELVANPDVSRMAAFADAAFKLWMPKVYNDVNSTLNKLYEHDRSLTKNWKANAYPCAAFNFGPRVRCKPHKDFGNAPQTFCAVQASGRFNPMRGGHLIIKELKIFICFPPASTILIPSALLTHSNTPVGAHEIRLSFTQFVPGGLLRYVHNGFKTERRLKKRSKKVYNEKMEAKKLRWKCEFSMISTLDELKALYLPKNVRPSSGVEE